MRILILVLLIAVCLAATKYSYAMPPAPELLDKIRRAEIDIPYPISEAGRKALITKGVDLPSADFDIKSFLKKPQSMAASDGESAQATPPTGSFKVLVVLVDFADKPASVPPLDFDRLIFTGDQSNPTKTWVRQYYLETSYGQLAIDAVNANLPSQLGWQRLTNDLPYSYYVNNAYGLGGYPQNTQKLMEAVVDQIDPMVNFADYDNDGNGKVDGVVLVHPGRGAELSGSVSDIWSHKWGITPRSRDGVSISAYTIQPEYWNTPGDITIGVYAHEIGHLFGLPDLYDTDNSSRGVGKWSLMAGGSWNGTLGSSPAHLGAWEKTRLGWVTPIEAASTKLNVQFPNAEQFSSGIFKLMTTNPANNEYFLIENRQKIGFDSSLPGAGLLVWHVDDSKSSNNKEWWPGNSSNGNYWVALEQADGLWDLERNIDQGDAGDPFPGSRVNRSFMASSSPSSDTYSGNLSGVCISAISDSSSLMTAEIVADPLGGYPCANITPNPSPTPTNTRTFTATPTVTGIASPSATFTVTQTPTVTAAATSTPTSTAVNTPTLTVTFTATATLTATRTPTTTNTATRTAMVTNTATSTVTAAPSSTPTALLTATITATSTQTVAPSFTSTATRTSTPTNTRTRTATRTASATATTTPSVSATSTPTVTSTATSTSSATQTPIASASPSWTSTPEVLATNSPVLTVTATPTPVSVAAKTPGYGGSKQSCPDIDGDGLADRIKVKRDRYGRQSGKLYRLSLSESGSMISSVKKFGQAGDIPALADYDGDGKTDFASVRERLGRLTWITEKADGSLKRIKFGRKGEQVISGCSFDGDEKADPALFSNMSRLRFISSSTGRKQSVRLSKLSFARTVGIACTDTDRDGFIELYISGISKSAAAGNQAGADKLSIFKFDFRNNSRTTSNLTQVLNSTLTPAELKSKLSPSNRRADAPNVLCPNIAPN